MVETSVAVATPSITAVRITNGSSSEGNAIASSRSFSRPPVRAPCASSRQRNHATAASTSASTAPGSRPPVNSAAIDTPVTEPMVISTRLGGIVSLIAPDAARIAINSPSRAPRRFISGNSTGATAAMSAALDPEIPETRYIAPSRTKYRPPRTWPSSEARNATIARAMPVISISNPRNTNSGTASSTRLLIPSSMRETMMLSGMCEVQSRKARVDIPNANPIRHAGEHADGEQPDEEDHQIPVAEILQPRCRESERRRHDAEGSGGRSRNRRDACAAVATRRTRA